MIKTYRTNENGELGTHCHIKGSRLDIYNDFLAIISVCCEDSDLIELLGEALSDMDSKLKKKVEELRNDKNNTCN